MVELQDTRRPIIWSSLFFFSNSFASGLQSNVPTLLTSLSTDLPPTSGAYIEHMFGTSTSTAELGYVDEHRVAGSTLLTADANCLLFIVIVAFGKL